MSLRSWLQENLPRPRVHSRRRLFRINILYFTLRLSALATICRAFLGFLFAFSGGEPDFPCATTDTFLEANCRITESV